MTYEEPFILTEYEQAQKSAEHHNTIMWTLIYIGIGLSLLIFYIVLTAHSNISILLKISLLSFGSLILFYFSYIIEKTNQKRERMYQICKNIEKLPKFKVKIHSKIEKLPLTNKLKGIKILRIIKLILFIVYLTSILYLGINNFEKLLSSNFLNLLCIAEIFYSLPLILIFIILEIIWYWKK